MDTDSHQAEVVVRAVWSELLGIENAPADADFFALGGDSLLLVRFAGRLRSELARQVAPHELLARPTPAGMTAVVLAAEALEPEESEPDFETRAESDHISTLIHADPHPAQKSADAGPLPPGAWAFAVRLNDTIEQDTLAEALTWVARRHRSLRTSFAADGEARIAPARTIECPLEVIAARPDTAADHLAGPIDRGTAPLVRAVLTGSTLTLAVDRAVCGAAAVPAFLADLHTVWALMAEGSYAELAEEQPDFPPDPDLRSVELEWVRAV